MQETASSKGEQRRQGIMLRLKQNGRITITEIIEQFDCSEATARRDLDILEKNGSVIRTIGGALLEGFLAVKEVSFTEKQQKLWVQKEAIARKAVELIEEGDIIGLSGGTTTFLIARELKKREGITVVTNAVNIAMELADNDALQVVVIGGVMRGKSYELCGPLAEKTIEHLNIGKMFLGIDGLTLEQGPTTYSELEAQTARTLLSHSQQTIAVFDHTKLDRASLFSIAPLDALYGCITDDGADPAFLRKLAERGVQVYSADV